MRLYIFGFLKGENREREKKKKKRERARELSIRGKKRQAIKLD